MPEHPTQPHVENAVPFWIDLHRFGARDALITEGQKISYVELARLVDAKTADLRLVAGLRRPLVAFEFSRELNAVIAYLACLSAGWPMIVLEPGSVEGNAAPMIGRFGPNVLLRGASDWRGERASTDHVALHPDLRVLLSTSGTTGAAKLVRLSLRNIASNAAAISAYLGTTDRDRAITSLPLHYSYGLSVLHSHLAAGASLVLTRHGIETPEFWSQAERENITSMALVPAQVGLFLDRAGNIATLRRVTQAGGKLGLPQVRKMAACAKSSGWDFTIMYGQTEASPRMAYLPANQLAGNEASIGRAIQGGQLTLQDASGALIDRPGVTGELIYRGPNVMMGYAETPGDLALPQGPDILATGDMAELSETGFFRITGRKSRFIKPFGLRVSLDQIETHLAARGIEACVTGTDSAITVFTCEGADVSTRALGTEYGLPWHIFQHYEISHIPRLPSGKTDYKRLQNMADAWTRKAPPPAMIGVLREALGPDLDLDRSFAEHGGDSLAYLHVQTRLSQMGGIAQGWANRPLRDLAGDKNARWPVIEADLMLRLLAITMVVGLHATNFSLAGGTFLLLILMGHSLARFQSGALFDGNLTRMMDQMLRPLLVGFAVILTATHFLRAPVSVEWFLLIANFDGEPLINRLQPYWFVCTYAQIVAMVAVPFAVPAWRGWIARHPVAAGGIGLVALTFAAHMFGLAETTAGLRQRNPLAAGQFVLIGWCIAHSRTTRAKLVTALMAVGLGWAWSDLTIPQLILIGTGITGLLLGARLAAPGPLFQAVSRLGTLTLAIYLIHPALIGPVWKLNLPDLMSLGLVLALSITAGAVLQMMPNLMRSRRAPRQAVKTAP